LGQAPPRLGWRARPSRLRRPRAQAWLDQAGAEVNPTQFWAVSVLGGALAFVMVAGMTGTVTVALLPAVGVAGLPRAYYAAVRRNGARSRTRAWPDALRHL